MEVGFKQTGSELVVTVDGRIDTTTAPQLEEAMDGKLEGVERLVFDLAKVDYISSAGLRIILTCLQVMCEQGEMVLRNVCDEVKEIFEITGFLDELNIE